MNPIKRFTTLVLNPVVLALCTSSLGFAASTLSSTTPESSLPEGVVLAHDNGMVIVEGAVEVTALQPRLTEGEIVVEQSGVDEHLAARFSEALTARASKAKSSGVRARHHASVTNKQWVCGAWEELWQGRGQGRSCEWK